MIEYPILIEYLIKLFFELVLAKITALTKANKVITLIYRSIRNLC